MTFLIHLFVQEFFQSCKGAAADDVFNFARVVGGSFLVNPELDEKCSDIKVQINYVDSGDYRYTPIKDRVKVNYRLSGKTAESGADIYTRQRSHEPGKRLFSFLVGVILTLLIVINLVQIALPFLKDNLGNKRSSGGKEISISRSYDETEETE